jgi:hypothetical protein
MHMPGVIDAKPKVGMNSASSSRLSIACYKGRTMLLRFLFCFLALR